ncbi:MAG: stage III sporulation protein AE [Clostridia bacterium]|nr:stage III sporulation protein AE [Clostridia bacterium]
MKIAFLIFLMVIPGCAAAESLEDAILSQLSALDLTPLESAWQTAFPDGISLQDMLGAFARGEAVLSGEEMLQSLFSALFQTFSASLWRMAHLLAPAILCGLMEKMKGAFAKSNLGDILCTVCYLLLTAVMARDLGEHLQLCRQNVDRMATLMQTLFPLLLTLLAAVGSTAGAAFFQPATVAACGAMTTLVHKCTLPLALSGAVTGLMDHLSPKVRLTRLSSLFQTAVNWTLGIGFTVFLSVTALQALGAAAADGVSLRTAKYVADHFVPVVGGMFADTMDSLVGASLLIKNAAGVTGLVVLLAMCAHPMLQTLCAAGIYRSCAALMEPVADQRISSAVHHFSRTLMMFFVIQLSVSAMFILLVAQMLAVGQLTVMLQ